ncbi:Metallo-dependent phosphatase-like protein [Irpex rosettiformis]|uniref:Metallo-dependent phosphatase-like protein n=1 Tax=Irpex rosettiformis TaxID=378272 RepID=A0ACB8UEC0_9APHY|nr:Metallo-dependent phosphatase-like protein [Irpex rosettiformis]
MLAKTSATLSLLLFLVGIQDAFGLPAATYQQPMQVDSIVPGEIAHQIRPRPPRKLHGRFLHLTDMHPDPFYRAGTSEVSACHRNKPKKASPRAGEFGYRYGECDSPLLLTNYTLDYLEKNWADEVDFVVWTGDSARHDNDRKLPRTLKEIYELNRHMASRMEEIFTARGIPVIPSIGNNDVWPHNIMLPGPNDVTFEFSSIWKSFVPFYSYQVFQRGAYYAVEVIPNRLAVVALNTMYFFDSNKGVAGCDPKDREDPGNLQFDWLEVQLSQFRSRGLQVWITGHVPPSARNYHTECYIRYVELSLRYQDTILGHLYGHMNVDHFFLLDATNLNSDSNVNSDSHLSSLALDHEEDGDDGDSNDSNSDSDPEDDTVSVSGKHKELYKSLLKNFNYIAKQANKNIDYDALAVVNVGPSVVPNPYLPSFRVYAYNITGEGYVPASVGSEGVDAGYSIDDDEGDLEDENEDKDEGDWIRDGFTFDREEAEEEELMEEEEEERGEELEVDRHLGDYVDRESWCPTGKESWACLLTGRWHSSPQSPSRANRLFSPIGFAQYYLPDMNGTAKKPPKWKLEYLTFEPSKLHPPNATKMTSETTTRQAVEDAEFVYPMPLKRLPKKLRTPEVKKSRYAPYKMKDLTIPSWLRLVKRLGKKKNEKLRERFRGFMYMGANAEL